MIYIVSATVFLSVILFLVILLLILEAKVVKKGDCKVTINNDKDLMIPGSTTVLSALLGNNILLPSACGGQGTCGMCKIRCESGGGSVLPTELGHLSRKEKGENVRLACQLKIKEDMSIKIPDEIFSIKRYTATVHSNYNVATFIKELILDLEPGVDIGFKAGGYMQIDIPAYSISFSEFEVEEEYRDAWDGMNLWRYKASIDEPIFRAYSCSTAPYEKGVIKFTIRIATPPPWAPEVSPGLGSTYLWNLKPGDKVTLSGPYGEFFVKPTGKEMCFIGGGAGMAPMRSHIFDQLNAVHTDRKITFWYGARSFREMFFDDEFKALQEKNPNFSYNVALSEPQPEDNWTGMTGFIHQALYDNYLVNHEDPTEIEYYLCGPPPMIDAVVRMLDDLGVEEENILYDKF